MNSFQKQREETLRRLLEPFVDPDEIQEIDISDLLEYVEKEISAAFGRGLRHSRKQASAAPAEGVPSALQAGLLKRKERVA